MYITYTLFSIKVKNLTILAGPYGYVISDYQQARNKDSITAKHRCCSGGSGRMPLPRKFWTSWIWDTLFPTLLELFQQRNLINMQWHNYRNFKVSQFLLNMVSLYMKESYFSTIAFQLFRNLFLSNKENGCHPCLLYNFAEGEQGVKTSRSKISKWQQHGNHNIFLRVRVLLLGAMGG